MSARNVTHVDCPWCLRSWRADDAGRPESHKRLSVAPEGGSRLVPCVSPTMLAAMGLAPRWWRQ